MRRQRERTDLTGYSVEHRSSIADVIAPRVDLSLIVGKNYWANALSVSASARPRLFLTAA